MLSDIPPEKITLLSATITNEIMCSCSSSEIIIIKSLLSSIICNLNLAECQKKEFDKHKC